MDSLPPASDGPPLGVRERATALPALPCEPSEKASRSGAEGDFREAEVERFGRGVSVAGPRVTQPRAAASADAAEQRGARLLRERSEPTRLSGRLGGFPLCAQAGGRMPHAVSRPVAHLAVGRAGRRGRSPQSTARWNPPPPSEDRGKEGKGTASEAKPSRGVPGAGAGPRRGERSETRRGAGAGGLEGRERSDRARRPDRRPRLARIVRSCLLHLQRISLRSLHLLTCLLPSFRTHVGHFLHTSSWSNKN
jgi:hypothetical protein